MAWCDFNRGSNKCEAERGYIHEIRDRSIVRNYCNTSTKWMDCPHYLYYRRNKGNGRFYVTTLICQLLDKSEDDKVLTTLTKFREEYLEKNEKYSEFLRIYDVVGPRVCCEMFQDDNAVEKAKNLYPKLERFAELVDNSEMEKAADSYIAFTLGIIAQYNMDDIYRNVRDRGMKK